jgi:hypothetical protein
MRTSITPESVAAFIARRNDPTNVKAVCYVRATRRGARPARVK